MPQTPAALRVRPYPFDIRIRQPGIAGTASLGTGKWLREHRDMCEGRLESNLSSCIPDHTNEAPFPASTGFPSVFFLDVNVFKRHRLKAPMPQMATQDSISKEIGNDLDIRATVRLPGCPSSRSNSIKRYLLFRLRWHQMFCF
jgi:hypothetical protein